MALVGKHARGRNWREIRVALAISSLTAALLGGLVVGLHEVRLSKGMDAGPLAVSASDLPAPKPLTPATAGPMAENAMVVDKALVEQITVQLAAKAAAPAPAPAPKAAPAPAPKAAPAPAPKAAPAPAPKVVAPKPVVKPAPKAAPKIAPLANLSRGPKIVAAARSYLGVPYRFGGTTRSGIDCSSLVQHAMQDAGIKGTPRTSAAQAGWVRPISRGELQPGDLVFFYSPISHVGIYIGGNQMIDAPRDGVPVGVHNLYPGATKFGRVP